VKHFLLGRTLSPKALLLKGIRPDLKEGSPSSKGLESGLVEERSRRVKCDGRGAGLSLFPIDQELTTFPLKSSLTPFYGMEGNWYAKFLLEGYGSNAEG
jgi:hypothetical protein